MDRGALTEQLKRHEGSVVKNGRHVLYKDSEGIWTIGYGCNVEQGLDEDEAEFLLSNRIDNAIMDCKLLPFWHELDGIRQQVVANMVYNLGLQRFLEFKKMIAAIERGDWKDAAKEGLDSKWAHQVGGRANELMEMLEGY